MCVILSRNLFHRYHALAQAVRSDESTSLRKKSHHGASDEDEAVFKNNRAKIADTGIIQALLKLCDVTEEW